MKNNKLILILLAVLVLLVLGVGIWYLNQNGQIFLVDKIQSVEEDNIFESEQFLDDQYNQEKEFVQEQPCGPLPDGSNTCVDPGPVGSYYRLCSSNQDCFEDKTCQEIEAYSGDAVIYQKVCK